MFYEPETNAPKQYACFLETIFLETKKKHAKYFLIGTVETTFSV
jgi:hypothetical protein